MRRQTTYGNNHDDVGAAEEAKALITKRKFSTEEHKKSTVTCASSFNCVFFLLWLFSSHEIDVLRDSKSPPKLQSLLLSRVAFSIFCGEMNQFSIGSDRAKPLFWFRSKPKPKPNGFWETETETETEANTQYIAIFRFLDYFFFDNLGSEQ